MKPPFSEVRKVQSIGHSHLISIPALWCKANGVEKGTKLKIELHPDKVILTVDKEDESS